VVSWCLFVLRWLHGETMAEEKRDRSVEKELSGRKKSRHGREQDLANKMATADRLADRFESRGELHAMDNKWVIYCVPAFC